MLPYSLDHLDADLNLVQVGRETQMILVLQSFSNKKAPTTAGALNNLLNYYRAILLD